MTSDSWTDDLADIDSKSVSYTHLDVYKRQVHTSWLEKKTSHRTVLSEVHTFEKSRLVDQMLLFYRMEVKP